MNITIKPWKPGDGGLICLPLRSNIPDASKHPTLGAAVCVLWAVFLILSAIGTVVTHKDAKKKAAELHMVAYATYQLSLRIDELNNSKTKKEDPENEENNRTE